MVMLPEPGGLPSKSCIPKGLGDLPKISRHTYPMGPDDRIQIRVGTIRVYVLREQIAVNIDPKTAGVLIDGNNIQESAV